MTPAEFKPAIPASEQPHPNALEGAATVIGSKIINKHMKHAKSVIVT
jgi:hypothetical protein